MKVKKICEECGKELKFYQKKYCCNACRAKVSRRKLSSNLSGKKFGRWTIVSQVESNVDGASWNCICECGIERIVLAASLQSGNSKSCGCWHREVSAEQASVKFSKPVIQDTRFGRLTVIRENGRMNGCVAYLCQCDCGKQVTTASIYLRNGDTKSCGCLKSDSTRERFTTHGLSNKPHFSRWRHQVRREADSGWTIEMNQLLFEIQPACVVCGSTKKLTADHVRPVLLGGKLVPGNVVVLCLACNDKKSYREISRLPKDWQEKIEHAARQFLDMWNSR